MSSLRRPTEVSWDSDDDELLKEDTSQLSGVSAFPKSKNSVLAKIDSDEEFDENALLYSDNEEESRPTKYSATVDKKKSTTSSSDNKKSVSNNNTGKKTFTKITPPSPDHKTKSSGNRKDVKGQNKQTYSPISAPVQSTQPVDVEPQQEVLDIGDPEEYSLFDESKETDGVVIENTEQEFRSQDTEVVYEEHSYEESTTLVVDEARDSSALEDTFENDIKAPSDSESDSDDEEKGRGRFKSERSMSNSTSIVTIKAKPRDTIPDTLEISDEQQAQIDEFMTQGNRGKGRGRGRGHNRRGGPQGRFQPYSQQSPQQQAWTNQAPPAEQQPPQQFPYPQQMPPQQQPPYQQEPHHAPAPHPTSSSPLINLPGQVPSQPQPRKILINPHFRGSRPQSANSQPARTSGGVYTGPQMPGPHVVSSHQPQPLLSLNSSQPHNTGHAPSWPVQTTGPPYPVQNAPSASQSSRFPMYQGGPKPQQHYPGPGAPPTSVYQQNHPAPQPLRQHHPHPAPPQPSFGQPNQRGPTPFTGQGHARMQGPAIPFQQQQAPPQRYPSPHLHPPHQAPHQSILGSPPGSMSYNTPPTGRQQFHPGSQSQHRAPLPPHLLQMPPHNQQQTRPGFHQSHGMPQQHGMQPRGNYPHGNQPRGNHPMPLMGQQRRPGMIQQNRPNLQQNRPNFQQNRPNLQQQANNQQFANNRMAKQMFVQSQKLKERAKKFQINKQQQQNEIQSISTLINRVGQKRPSTDKQTGASPTKVTKKPVEDEELLKGLEAQKRMREEIRRKKETRRQAVAVIRRKELEQKLASQGKTIEDVEATSSLSKDKVLTTPKVEGQGSHQGQGQTIQTRTNTVNVRPGFNRPFQGTPRPTGPQGNTPAVRQNVQQGIRMQNPNFSPGPRNPGPSTMQGPRHSGPHQHGPRQFGPRSQGQVGPRNQTLNQRNPGISVPRNPGPRPLMQTSPRNKTPAQPMTGAGNRVVNPPTMTLAAQNTNQNSIGKGMVKKKKVTILRKNAQGEVIGRTVIWKPFTEETESPVTMDNNTTSQRTVINSPARVVKLGQGQRKVIDSSQPRRVILGGEAGGPQPSRVVAVDNLSTSTSESMLRKMAEELGPLSGIEHLAAAKKAKITFVNAKHATEFVNKYHRHMVDLSHLSVTLLPG